MHPRNHAPLSAVLLLAIAAAATTGCGQNAGPEPVALDETVTHPVTAGPIGVRFKDLIAQPNLGDCDARSAAIRKEIADELDKRQEAIQKHARSAPPSEDYTRVKLGPGTALEPVRPMSPTRAWGERTKSWAALHETYLKIKNLPVGDEWAALDTNTRSILVDDESRLVYRSNLYLNKDSGPILDAIQSRLTACDNDPACAQPELTAEQSRFLFNNPFFAPDWLGIQSAELLEKRREHLESLRKRVKTDFRRYEFRPDKTVRRKNAQVIQLPLVAGVFEGVTKQLSGYVNAVWSSPGMSVEIDWVESKAVPKAFRVLLDPIIGQRAYVNYQDRVMQLFLDVRAKTVAHELGHVLGFRDHYYTVWHPETCSYVIQNNQSDVMSDSVHGYVTQDEWQTLDARYPLF